MTTTSGKSGRRQQEPPRPRFERPPSRKPSSSSSSPNKPSSPAAGKSPGSSRPQLVHGASDLTDRSHHHPHHHQHHHHHHHHSNSPHRSVQSVLHPIMEARKRQEDAMAARLLKEQLRKEQEELAEAIERSLEVSMNDVVPVSSSDEGNFLLIL